MEKESFIQEYLYLEEPIPQPPKEKNKEEEVSRGVIVIDILGEEE